MQLFEQVLERALQPVGGAIDRRVRGVRLEHDDGGLMALDASLDRAAVAALVLLVPTFVTQVDVHAVNARAKSTQRALHHPRNVVGELLAVVDVGVDVDSNFPG